MQKFVNVLAIASATVSLAVVSGGIYLYTQKDAIIESVTEKALGSIGGGALNGLSGSALKGLPDLKSAPDADAPTSPQTLPDFSPGVKF